MRSVEQLARSAAHDTTGLVGLVLFGGMFEFGKKLHTIIGAVITETLMACS